MPLHKSRSEIITRARTASIPLRFYQRNSLPDVDVDELDSWGTARAWRRQVPNMYYAQPVPFEAPKGESRVIYTQSLPIPPVGAIHCPPQPTNVYGAKFQVGDSVRCFYKGETSHGKVIDIDVEEDEYDVKVWTGGTLTLPAANVYRDSFARGDHVEVRGLGACRVFKFDSETGHAQVYVHKLKRFVDVHQREMQLKKKGMNVFQKVRQTARKSLILRQAYAKTKNHHTDHPKGRQHGQEANLAAFRKLRFYWKAKPRDPKKTQTNKHTGCTPRSRGA